MPLTQYHDLYLRFAKLLEPFYPLVDLINQGKTLTHHDLRAFDEGVISDVVYVQKLYNDTKRLRTCGNPMFIHHFRCLVWAKSLGLPVKVQRLALMHDLAEDFGSKYPDMQRVLRDLPESIRKDIEALSNKYKPLVNSLASCLTVNDLKKKLLLLEETKQVKRFLAELKELQGYDTPLEYLEENFYRYYIEDLVEHAKSNPEVLLVKLIDRVDNTLTDAPSNFSGFKKIYQRNAYVLDASEDLVVDGSRETKILYTILVSRSLRQVKFLIDRYKAITNSRGKFYGRQYERLRMELEDIEKLLSDFLPLLSSIQE